MGECAVRGRAAHAHRSHASVASGAFISLFPVVTTRLGRAEDVGLRTGVQMTIMSLGQHGLAAILGSC